MFKISEYIEELDKEDRLILVRGLPGAGKSSFAQKLVQALEEKHDKSYNFSEADIYFIRPDGIYDFNPKLIKNAHKFCFDEAEFWLKNSGVAIVSNTFSTKWEADKYLELANSVGCRVDVFRMTSSYGSIHNVPEEIIQKMKDRFEDFEGEILIDKYE